MQRLESPMVRIGTGKRIAWAFWTTLLFVMLAQSVAAQDEEFVPGGDDTDAQVTTGESSGAVVDGEEIDFGAVDDLLAQDEEVLASPDAYSYDPGARRDPFRSLLQKRTQEEVRQERPEGVPGLLIAELTIDGIFVLDEGPVAQVRSASESTSFLLRPGDELWDGDVVRITLYEVVFKQNVDDPTVLKPFREVVKRLNPSQP